MDQAFGEFCSRTDLPDFDFIGLHGIWSWVSNENRHILVDFIRRKLKVGGVLYISYNCFPGWSPSYPLRQMFALHDRFASKPHGAVQRVDAALKFSEALLAARPGYLKVAPQLPERRHCSAAHRASRGCAALTTFRCSSTMPAARQAGAKGRCGGDTSTMRSPACDSRANAA